MSQKLLFVGWYEIILKYNIIIYSNYIIINKILTVMQITKSTNKNRMSITKMNLGQADRITDL